MSRVEENANVRKDISEAMETVMKTVDSMDGDARVTLLNSAKMTAGVAYLEELINYAKMTAGVAYLEDISSSMAVIADSLSYIVEEESQCKKEREEKWKDREMPSYPSKSMYLSKVESRFQKAGITKEEWETWVNLRNKYLFGKKESEE